MAVALLALVMSTVGTATAATVVITSSAQIKSGTVTGSDVRNSSLGNGDIKACAIGLDRLSPRLRDQIGSTQVNATEIIRRVGPVDQPKGQVRRVATVQSLEAGVWVIMAKTTITGEPPESDLLNPGKANSAHCVLDAGGERDDARTVIGGPGFNSPSTLKLQLTRTFATPTPVALDCDAGESQWGASDTSIIAIKVGKAPKQAVDG